MSADKKDQPIVILLDINGTIGLKADRQIAGSPQKPVQLGPRRFIYCRPGCVELVKSLSEHPRCSVGIYTCWQPHNANAAVQALGIQNYVFYTYAQVTDPRFKWIAQDRSRYNEVKKMYEWKKDVSNLLIHVSKELHHPITLDNIILIDDTPDKTRDCPDNVIVPPEFTEQSVKMGRRSTLPALQAYLLELLNNCGSDVREYMKSHPFDEANYLEASMGMLNLSTPSCSRHIDVSDRAGKCGSTVQTLHSSQFKLWYVQFSEVDIKQVILSLQSLLGLRNGRWVGKPPELKTLDDTLWLWTGETKVSYKVKRGDHFIVDTAKNDPFYKFINHELRFDAHDTMQHVAYIARAFNHHLAAPFTPKQNHVYRGSCMPLARVRGFFSEDNLKTTDNYFRIPAFFAASYLKSIAETFESMRAKGDEVPVLYDILLPPKMFHAKDVSEYSRFAEAEVLFPPYSLFQFVALSPSGNGYRVEIQAAADNKQGPENVPSPMWQ